MSLDSAAARVRVSVYEMFLRVGRGPTLDEVVAGTELRVDVVQSALHRLAEAHVVVLQRGSDSVWMAMPFSGVPTDFRVTADRLNGTAGAWWANCAWDALGIPAMFAGAGIAVALGTMHIETTCPDCERPLSLAVRTDAASAEEAVRLVPPSDEAGASPPAVHFAVPASRWWDDIGFT